jgi:hypothetical protein
MYGRARVDFALTHLALEEALSFKSSTFRGLNGPVFCVVRLLLLLFLFSSFTLMLAFLSMVLVDQNSVAGFLASAIGGISVLMLSIALCILTQAVLGERFDNSMRALPFVAPLWKLFSACSGAVVRFVSGIVLGSISSPIQTVAIMAKTTGTARSTF